MKILLTSELDSTNSLIFGLYKRLNKFIDIESSVNKFWDKNFYEYDLIHIQWPEELFCWKNIVMDDLIRLTFQLNKWKEHDVKIVVTRHNIYPHKLNDLYKDAYELIYTYTDAIIHFSNTSIDNFYSIYDQKKIYPIHKVIFHPMYSDIPNDINNETARQLLGIEKNKKVILIFGSMRHEYERQFSKSVYNSLNIKNKLLIVPNWYEHISARHEPVKWCLSKIRFLFDYFNKEVKLNRKIVSEKEIQVYMNAADIIFIPRFEVLNSGVLMLAYSFNKIVVGPSTGSIGELLELSKNPSYEIGNVFDAAFKIKEGFNLSEGKVNNYTFAVKHMNWDMVIRKHIQLYEKLI